MLRTKKAEFVKIKKPKSLFLLLILKKADLVEIKKPKQKDALFVQLPLTN